MKNLRWPIFIVIPLILTALVFWENSEREISTPAEPTTSSMVWFCPVLKPDGLLELYNPTRVGVTANLTYYSSLIDRDVGEEESEPYLADTFAVTLPSQTNRGVNILGHLVDNVQIYRFDDVLRIFDLIDQSAIFISVLVEFSIPAGATLNPAADPSICTNQASDTWFIPFASTNRDTCYYLAIFNPFTAPAVLDIEFATDTGRRSPFEGKVIPARSSVVLNISGKVTRRNHISTDVRARTGRVVVGKYQTFTGKPDELERTCPSDNFNFIETSEPRLWGSQVAVGAPAGSRQWFFPAGVSPLTAENKSGGSYTIYNPDKENPAEVQLKLQPDVGSLVKLSLIVPPAQRVAVQITEGDLHPLPLFPAPIQVSELGVSGIANSGHWASFESATEIVVEKLQTEVKIRNGVLGGLGVVRPATLISIYKKTLHAILNPSSDTIARVRVAGVISVAEIGPGRRYILEIPKTFADGGSVLSSTTPVVAGAIQ